MRNILTLEETRVLNDARTILGNVVDACSRSRRVDPGNWTDADGYDHGRAAQAAVEAEWAIFNALNVINAHAVQTIAEDVLHNREDNPVRQHGRADDITVDTDEDGYHLTISTDSGSYEYVVGDGQVVLDAAQPILDHWAEGKQAAADHQRHLEAVSGDGYDPTDPKHPGYHSLMSGLSDDREA